MGLPRSSSMETETRSEGRGGQHKVGFKMSKRFCRLCSDIGGLEGLGVV